jgi:hypothetical protein
MSQNQKPGGEKHYLRVLKLLKHYVLLVQEGSRLSMYSVSGDRLVLIIRLR